MFATHVEDIAGFHVHVGRNSTITILARPYAGIRPYAANKCVQKWTRAQMAEQLLEYGYILPPVSVSTAKRDLTDVVHVGDVVSHVWNSWTSIF